jgi:hypothetical protein
MTPSKIPVKTVVPAAAGGATKLRATFITQINKAEVAALAARLNTTEPHVINIALARLLLDLFEGEPPPSDDDFILETRISTDEAFQAAQVPPPVPRSPCAGNLLDLLRQEQEKW